MTNSADPDQLASSEANWSGSTLFAKTGYVVFSRRRVNKSSPEQNNSDLLLYCQYLTVKMMNSRYSTNIIHNQLVCLPSIWLQHILRWVIEGQLASFVVFFFFFFFFFVFCFAVAVIVFSSVSQWSVCIFDLFHILLLKNFSRQTFFLIFPRK